MAKWEINEKGQIMQAENIKNNFLLNEVQPS